MFATIRNVMRTTDLRNKILFTLSMIAVYRVGVQIPSPGVSLEGVETLSEQATTANGIFGYLQLMSGGGISRLSIFALGIMPYITASIIIQILTVAIPKLEEWQAQGAVGQRKISQWTRYVSMVLAVIQSTGFVYLIHNNPQSLIGTNIELFPNGSAGRILLAVTCMTVGTGIVMWLGELITQKGIGNGMSLLIMASVVSALPGLLQTIWTQKGPVGLIISLILFVVLTAGIVYVEQGQRRIPVTFNKRVVGRRQYGGNNSYIPLKVNQAGVIPVIFASSLLQLPSLVANVLPPEGWGASVRTFMDNNLYAADRLGYIVLFGLLIVGFAYFYNAIGFDPPRRADELRKSGGYIQGIRPGPQTEVYLTKVLNRITLPGALFLAFVALIPSAILARSIGAGGNGINVGFSGVSILIAVGVALETMKQIDSQLMSRNYDGFLQ